MSRLSKEELDKIMVDHNVERLWSWSKISTFMTSPYEYFLSYIKHVPTDRNDCAYTVLGTLAHETLEGYYEGKLEYDDMLPNFEDGWLLAVDIADLKLDRNDNEKDALLKQRYHDNLELFFRNHIPYKYNLSIEKPIVADIAGHVFVGYIDALYKDEYDNYTILDYKTSSKYVGKALEEHAGQLTIYAIGLTQAGVPLEKIRAGFNFLKYVTVRYQQKNGATKEKIVERCKLAEGIESNCRMWLKSCGLEESTDEYMKRLIDTNDISCLPDVVRDKYIVEDCHVYISLTQKDIDKWVEMVDNTINDIEWREREYDTTGNEEVFWDGDENIEQQSYYFSTLCGYSRRLHKPWDMYSTNIEKRKTGIDLLVPDMAKNKSVKVNVASDDLAWLEELVN